MGLAGYTQSSGTGELTKMIQLQYLQLDRHKMIYQYDATEIYMTPQMNLINLEDMGTSIEFKDFPRFSMKLIFI